MANFKLREDNTINAMMDIMQNDMITEDDALVGPFWYDKNDNELFGVYSVPAEDVPFLDSRLFGEKVRTGKKLHKDIWGKEQYRKHKDPRFKGNHTLVPRGRVFQTEDGMFKVMVGNWINDYPEAKELIISEFQLPKDKTEFIVDEHWDIGHGFSDDFLEGLNNRGDNMDKLI